MYVVIGNGDWDSQWGRTFLSGPNVRKVICADGGANAALASGRIPDVLIGDLDSITPQTLRACREAGVEILLYPAEKDEVDLELTLTWAHQAAGDEEIVLLGAGGGRIDHLLGTIGLLIKFAEQGRRIRMIDSRSEAWVVLPGREDCAVWRGRTLSILPLSRTATIQAGGMKYPLDPLTLYRDTPRGLSNVVEGDGWIEVRDGIVLVVVNTKKDTCTVSPSN